MMNVTPLSATPRRHLCKWPVARFRWSCLAVPGVADHVTVVMLSPPLVRIHDPKAVVTRVPVSASVLPASGCVSAWTIDVLV